mmetsp:Transcript_28870/g.62226  ORF Transcript_28870/g.62226 Transcript_28870/m.62226 type:complete len:367 (+) Transcript_28870:69-1169(+)
MKLSSVILLIQLSSWSSGFHAFTTLYPRTARQTKPSVGAPSRNFNSGTSWRTDKERNPFASSSLRAKKTIIDTGAIEEAPTVELSEAEIELISRRAKKLVNFPFIPRGLEKQVIKMALTAFCKAGPRALPEGLFMQLVTNEVEWDDVNEEVVRELNAVICIPIISREIQEQVINSLCIVMFKGAKGQMAMERKLIGKALQASLNKDSDDDLAAMLNGMIDIPLMSEEQEQELFLKLSRSIMNTFETLVPEPMREILTNTSPEELREARLNLIDRMNEAIDIPFKSEKEEEEYFTAIVDFLLTRYGLDKGTKLPEEQLVDVEKELDVVAVEYEVSENIYRNSMEELDAKKKSLEARKAELEAMISSE